MGDDNFVSYSYSLITIRTSYSPVIYIYVRVLHAFLAIASLQVLVQYHSIHSGIHNGN